MAYIPDLKKSGFYAAFYKIVDEFNSKIVKFKSDPRFTLEMSVKKHERQNQGIYVFSNLKFEGKSISTAVNNPSLNFQTDKINKNSKPKLKLEQLKTIAYALGLPEKTSDRTKDETKLIKDIMFEAIEIDSNFRTSVEKMKRELLDEQLKS